MKYQDFINMDINLKEFENVYNNYAENKVKFGGGNMKVYDLVNTYFGNQKLKGGADYGNGNDNLFYLLQNTNSSSTNVNQLSDLSYKSQLFPDYMNTSRS